MSISSVGSNSYPTTPTVQNKTANVTTPAVKKNDHDADDGIAVAKLTNASASTGINKLA